MSAERWLRAISLDGLKRTLAKKSGATVKIGGRQLAVFLEEDEGVRAVDNRCPHEGYPLATGPVKGGVLTCEWHNWKFRLRDGKCLFGGEDIRSYPTRVTDGDVWIDVADNELGELAPIFYASLAEALNEGEWDQAGRTIERLLSAGEGPLDILAFACERAAKLDRYGFEHGLAAAADWAVLLERFPEEQGVILLEAIHGLSEPNIRRSPRPVADAEAPADPEKPDQIGEELRARIDAEDLGGAEALMRGALTTETDDDALPSSVFGWLEAAVTDHFLGFGHAHIFTIKAEELMQNIGWRLADPIVTSLVTSIVLDTREDRLPYMRGYAKAMAAHAGSLERWADQTADPQALTPASATTLTSAALDGELEDALGAVAAALDARVAPDRIALALASAAAERLRRFDPAIDADDELGEGWLHPTHTMTHADAVRQTLLRRAPTAHTLRALFQSARFIQHMQPLDLAADKRGAPAEPPADLARTLLESLLTDQLVLPIFVAHHLKVVLAAERLDTAIQQDAAFSESRDLRLPLIAAARFLGHRQQERRIARMARRAHGFVHDGKPQKTLLGY